MKAACRLFACASAACAALPAGAQSATDDIVRPPVEIRSRKNAGDAPYAPAFMPANWGVAIVGTIIDEAIPIH